MNRTWYIMVNIGLIAILSVIGFSLADNETIILPLSTALILLVASIDYYLTYRRIKTGVYLKIGKRKSNYWILYLVMGLIWILLGFFEHRPNISWKGIDSKIFLGFLFISVIFFRYDNYIILVKNKFITFNDSNSLVEWKISKIEKIIMNNLNVAFIKKGRQKEFTLNEQEMIILKKYLTNRFKDRLIIE